jgi:glycosyltransferase involved in cell wall biosynthesis
MKKASLYICYYDITEPLVWTQVVAYLRELANRRYEIHLLTFQRRMMSPAEETEYREKLSASGIKWMFLKYHQRPSLPATLFDVIVGTLTAASICRRKEIGLIHARSHVATAMAWCLKRLLGIPYVFDYRGMLAEEYVDGGHWPAGGFKYRLTKRLERTFFHDADALVMLTHRIKRDLVRDESSLRDREKDITVIPCCVETSRFIANPKARDEYRAERNWQDRLILTYVGKAGLWYLVDEMAGFFAAAREIDPRFFFQVLTQGDPEEIRATMIRAGLPEDSYDIRFASQLELPVILGASDAGISLIQACDSKRASSPTKVGEYLAAGLPVVVNTGVGDCDETIEGDRLGVVMHDFSKSEMRRAANDLRSLLDERDIRDRCRSYAELELSLAQVGGPRYGALYQGLLGEAPQIAGGVAGVANYGTD